MRKPKKMSGVHSPLLPRGDQTQVELGNKYFELLSYPAGPYISFKMSAFSKPKDGRAGGKSGSGQKRTKIAKRREMKDLRKATVT